MTERPDGFYWVKQDGCGNDGSWVPARWVSSDPYYPPAWMLPGDELALTLDEDLDNIGPRLDPPLG